MTLINIFLSLLSLIATLSTFGGKTWKEGETTIFKRITRRGYVSLACMFLTFSLAIYKELSTKNLINTKNDQISELQSEVIKLSHQMTGYKEVLNVVKDRSDRVEQTVMAEAVHVNGTWHVPPV